MLKRLPSNKDSFLVSFLSIGSKENTFLIIEIHLDDGWRFVHDQTDAGKGDCQRAEEHVGMVWGFFENNRRVDR